MKTRLNLQLLSVTLIAALFTGCAGITEANLAQPDAQAPAVTAEPPVQSTEAPGYFLSGDEEDMIDVRPKREYREKEEE